MAADSAATDEEVGTKQPTIKVRHIPGQPILYGGSGDVGLLQKINESLAGFRPQGNLKRIRQELKRLVVPELADSRSLHVPYPQRGFNEPPPAILLIAGMADNRPWILEIERDGRDTAYNEDFGYFAAIGSGKPLAQIAFRPHRGATRDLRAGKVLAYRILDDAIDLAAAGLAPPIRLYTLDLAGTVTEVNEAEQLRIAETCELWRSIERDSLGQALAPQPATEPDLEIPLPDET